MGRIEQVAKEISQIAPRWMRVMHMGSVMPPTLTTSQLAVLLAIYEHGQSTTCKLSKVMKVSAPTITGLVDKLVQAEYVRRIHSQDDRRVINLELTKKGHLEAQGLFLRIRKRWESILTVLDVKEADSLLTILKKILSTVDKKNV